MEACFKKMIDSTILCRNFLSALDINLRIIKVILHFYHSACVNGQIGDRKRNYTTFNGYLADNMMKIFCSEFN